MTSHYEVAQAFMGGNKLTGSRMFTDGTTIWSYGRHFAISTKIGDVYLFNTDKRSSSTSHHQSIVRSALGDVDYIECNTTEIEEAVRHPERPIVITKELEPATVSGALEILKKSYKLNHPTKKYPAKVIEDGIYSALNLANGTHRSSLVFGGNKLSVRDYDTYVVIKHKKQEIKIEKDVCDMLADKMSQYSDNYFTRLTISLIKEKFANDPAVVSFVQKILDGEIKWSVELSDKILEENKLVGDL
jgi:hypothetical protein